MNYIDNLLNEIIEDLKKQKAEAKLILKDMEKKRNRKHDIINYVRAYLGVALIWTMYLKFGISKYVMNFGAFLFLLLSTFIVILNWKYIK